MEAVWGGGELGKGRQSFAATVRGSSLPYEHRSKGLPRSGLHSWIVPPASQERATGSGGHRKPGQLLLPPPPKPLHEDGLPTLNPEPGNLSQRM